MHPYADYVTVNISSPNTPGLRDLQASEALESIVSALVLERTKIERQTGKHLPLLVKIAPDLSDCELGTIAKVLRDCNIDGVVATNTTTNLRALPGGVREGQDGGLSGKPLFQRSVHTVSLLRSELGPRAVIVGVGGITDAQSAMKMLAAGANLLQVYTAFVFKGPALLQEIYDAIRTSGR